ncbi:MAG: efflux RND transporter periplasmic adaptor subunit [Chitinophagaceae bacterium]|jgi:RND family efflux transporter MFP subunit|nr:efflux RND transporter periplasmic adaptor subunit [Chitinophagaceae bacterium]
MLTKNIHTILLAGLILLAACGESKKENNAVLAGKMAELEKLKKNQEDLNTAIQKLQQEINQLNPDGTETERLVEIDSVKVIDFNHYIELQGRIDADNISIVTPRGNPGQVKEILVRKGDVVKKGQLLLKLDDVIYQQNIRASRESIATLKTQQKLALELLKRQQNLWNQGIGTEVQLLTAKNNVETLETQIKSAEEQVKVLLEQQKTTLVYAEVSGVADEVNIKVGEFFQGIMGTMPQIRIVNTSSLKVVTTIPENYAGKVSKGSKVEISIPDVNRTYSSSINFLSASIDAASRGFETEAKMPADGVLKPNMVAMVKILDYAAPAAITVPVNVIQSDEKGKYVFVAVTENGKMIARKKAVGIGQMQGDRVEIKAGLNAGEKLVTRGYQGLYDGQVIAEAPKL